ncbi:MFS transporter [Colwellia sp. RE-S-Sl-9]
MVDIAYQQNIHKYQIYSAISGFTVVGPLLNLFYLSADISYSQLSLIETASLITLVILEVPTGIISDLLGRKVSIFLGCILMGCEFVLIAAGFTLPVFVLAALIGGIGISLESGADQSLLYDSLKKLKRENEFKKYLGRSGAIFKISAAFAGILWGYIYQYDQSLVFYLTGSTFILLGFFSLTMKETVYRNTKKYQVSLIIKTTVFDKFISAKEHYHKAIKQICVRSYCTVRNNKKLLWMLLFTSLVGTTIRAHSAIIRGPMLDGLLPNAGYLGIILAVGMGLSSIVSWYADKLIAVTKSQYILIAFPVVAGFVYIFCGLLNNLFIVALFFLIYILTAYKAVFLSDYWHRHFSSKQRGTLLSFIGASESFVGVFSLLGIGLLTDALGLNNSSIIIGLLVLSFGFLLTFVSVNIPVTIKKNCY